MSDTPTPTSEQLDDANDAALEFSDAACDVAAVECSSKNGAAKETAYVKEKKMAIGAAIQDIKEKKKAMGAAIQDIKQNSKVWAELQRVKKNASINTPVAVYSYVVDLIYSRIEEISGLFDKDEARPEHEKAAP